MRSPLLWLLLGIALGVVGGALHFSTEYHPSSNAEKEALEAWQRSELGENAGKHLIAFLSRLKVRLTSETQTELLSPNHSNKTPEGDFKSKLSLSSDIETLTNSEPTPTPSPVQEPSPLTFDATPNTTRLAPSQISPRPQQTYRLNKYVTSRDPGTDYFLTPGPGGGVVITSSENPKGEIRLIYEINRSWVMDRDIKIESRFIILGTPKLVAFELSYQLPKNLSQTTRKTVTQGNDNFVIEATIPLAAKDVRLRVLFEGVGQHQFSAPILTVLK